MEDSQTAFFDQELISSQPLPPISFEPLQQTIDFEPVHAQPQSTRTKQQVKIEHLLAANLVTMSELLKVLGQNFKSMNAEIKESKSQFENGINLLGLQIDRLKDQQKDMEDDVRELVSKKRGRLQKDSERRKRKKEEKERDIEAGKQAFKKTRSH